ncbi:MAG: aminoacyl-tRNA hydrolase [Opitutaceae bacterium]|jgi:PTH1 family peptidyl-tRNA hydrolase|nr:aminoacyl-tRNA hydrolase [Opitutaceae bacterium]
MSTLLLAGLGNPGREYENTRHNAGFAVLDALASRAGLAWQKQRAFRAETARWDPAPDRSVLLVKPLLFMNDSGPAIQSAAGFFKIPAADIIAVHDDINIPFGFAKVSTSGGPGGHNGVASLITCFGRAFTRYRVGIGPKEPKQMELKEFVLGKFTPEQQTLFDRHIDHHLTGIRVLLEQGADRAMNLINRKTTT